MRILVASSGGHESDEPVTAATQFPWPRGSEIHVISVAEVVQPVMVGMVPDAVDAGAVQIETNEEAQRTATGATQRFRDLGFQALAVVAQGDPETAIIDHAKTWDANVIVVGSRDQSLIERLLVGSVSDRVVHHAPCSVLVVKQAES